MNNQTKKRETKLRLQCAISQQKAWVASLTKWDGMLVTGDWAFSVCCWNINTGRLVKKFQGHTGGVLCLQVMNGILYSGSIDTTIHCWDIQGKLLQILRGHTATIISLSADQENNLLFSGSEDTTIRAWNSFGNCVKIIQLDGPLVSMQFYKSILLRAHKEKITSMCVTRNQLFTGSYDKQIYGWDAYGHQTKQMTCACAVDLISEFEDGIVAACTNKLVFWDNNGSIYGTIQAPSSITCMQDTGDRLFLATTGHGVFILDDELSRNRKWNLTRLLFIARMKNSWSENCFISVLPIDIIHYLENFVWSQ